MDNNDEFHVREKRGGRGRQGTGQPASEVGRSQRPKGRRHTTGERKRERERERETDRQTDRQTGRQADRQKKIHLGMTIRTTFFRFSTNPPSRAAAGDLKRQVRKALEREVHFEERTIWGYFSQVCVHGLFARAHPCLQGLFLFNSQKMKINTRREVQRSSPSPHPCCCPA